MGNPLDLTGQRFSSLLVLCRSHVDKSGHVCWKCLCDCGNHTFVSTSDLRSGHSKSCGCKKTEVISQKKQKHGGAYERLYAVFHSMIDRCYRPSCSAYRNYGGRGITVCDEWRNDYAAFREWAMANGYDPYAPRGKCTIDRINVDGNYEPSNCRWVTMADQNKNKRPRHKKVTT